MIQVHAIPAFEDNYIWLIQAEHSQKVMIVDPGTAEPVLQVLQQHELEPVAILITHHHADHVDGIDELLSHFLVPVYGPARETIPHITHPVVEQDVIQIDPAFPPFKVFDTPGHTAGHICYFSENKLFCGDTLFAGGCGRLLGGTAADLFASLERLKQLPAETEIYCAHEYTQANLRFAKAVDTDNAALQQRIHDVEALRANNKASVPSLLADERATNPFLRSQLPEIKRAAELFAGRPLNNGEAVFTTLRRWKDQF